MKVVLGVDAVRYPITGIGRYVYELATCLSHLQTNEVYFLAGRQVSTNPPLLIGPKHTSNFGKVLLGSVKRSVRSRHLLKLYSFFQETSQSFALSSYKGAVFHGPNYYLPKHDGPCVSTFHDLSVFKHPEFHPQARVKFMEQELPKALKRADLLITDSVFTQKELIAFSGFSASKVISIPLATSTEFTPRDQVSCAEVLSRFQLTYKGYLLYAGTIEPRKNLINLLDAYEKMPVRLRNKFPLVIAGFGGWSNKDILKRINRAVTGGWLKHLGFVSSDMLPFLFAGAKTFAFPSVYEGFGLPVLEAIASGTPVVCSNSSSLPEVAGGCALMCDPGDVDSLSQLLVQSIEDDQWRATAIANGLIHASKYSWQETTSKTMEVYKLAFTAWSQ